MYAFNTICLYHQTLFTFARIIQAPYPFDLNPNAVLSDFILQSRVGNLCGFFGVAFHFPFKQRQFIDVLLFIFPKTPVDDGKYYAGETDAFKQLFVDYLRNNSAVAKLY